MNIIELLGDPTFKISDLIERENSRLAQYLSAAYHRAKSAFVGPVLEEK